MPFPGVPVSLIEDKCSNMKWVNQSQTVDQELEQQATVYYQNELVKKN